MDGERIILGIDPGTQLLGFGIIRVEGKKTAYVDMGVLDLRKEKDAYTKLQAIYDCISEVCKSYHPTELAIESPFYGKNAQVVLKLGRAQGSAILLVSSELTEIMSLSDRIYVIFEGKIVGEFQRGGMDDRHLGLLMVGGTMDHE